MIESLMILKKTIRQMNYDLSLIIINYQLVFNIVYNKLRLLLIDLVLNDFRHLS